jgi:hypothetical protein
MEGSCVFCCRVFEVMNNKNEVKIFSENAPIFFSERSSFSLVRLFLAGCTPALPASALPNSVNVNLFPLHFRFHVLFFSHRKCELFDSLSSSEHCCMSSVVNISRCAVVNGLVVALMVVVLYKLCNRLI